VRVLVEISCFLGSCHLKGRNIYGSKQDQDMLSWNAPTSVGEIHSFLGLAGYYQRFIERFLKITKTITELLERDKKFKWTSTREASFQELKK
jgi:hypothetical protein